MSFRSALFVSALAAGVLLSCQQLQEPVPTLTQDQWSRVQENILDEEPDVQNPVDAVFDDRFRLIGWDVEPSTATVGEEFTLTFYWQVLQETNQRWSIFVHLDGNIRQNADHEAVNDTYPTVYWRQGEIIRDSVTTTLSSGMSEGDITVFLGFYRNDQRLDVTRTGEGELQEDGRLSVGSFNASWQPTEYEIRRAVGRIRIDGRLTDRAWARARQTDEWVNPNSGEEVEDAEAWAKMLWDDEYLYIGLHATDADVWATLTDRDADLWDEEVLEVYLDPRRNGRNYLEIQVNPLNTVFDALFPSSQNRDVATARAHTVEGMETAVHVEGTADNRDDEDTSWTVEMRIPISSLPNVGNLPPRDGDQIRVNFYRYDRPDEETVRTAAWSPVGGGSFHNPDRFGVATFRGTARSRQRPRDQGAGAEGSGESAEAEGDNQPLRVNPRVHLNPVQAPQVRTRTE